MSLEKAMEYKRTALKRKYGPVSEDQYRRQCNQDSRWMQALMERRDPGRPKFRHDKEDFFKRARAKPHHFKHVPAEDIPPYVEASEVVTALFWRLACERAEASRKRPPQIAGAIVDDWWGKAPFMWGPFTEPVGDYTKEELAAIHEKMQSDRAIEQRQIEQRYKFDEAEEEGQDDVDFGSKEGEEEQGDHGVETWSEEEEEADMAEEEAEEEGGVRIEREDEGQRDEDGARGRQTRSPQFAGIFDDGEPLFQSIEREGEDKAAGSKDEPIIIS